MAIEILEGNALAKSITVLVGRGLLETLNQARLMDFLAELSKFLNKLNEKSQLAIVPI